MLAEREEKRGTLFNHLLLWGTEIYDNHDKPRMWQMERGFKDMILINVFVDRLTHKAYFINMNKKSYKLKEVILVKNS